MSKWRQCAVSDVKLLTDSYKHSALVLAHAFRVTQKVLEIELTDLRPVIVERDGSLNLPQHGERLKNFNYF